MILFYQVFRVKHRINYVSRVKIAFQAYYFFLGEIMIAKCSTFVVLEHVEDAILSAKTTLFSHAEMLMLDPVGGFSTFGVSLLR